MLVLTIKNPDWLVHYHKVKVARIPQSMRLSSQRPGQKLAQFSYVEWHGTDRKGLPEIFQATPEVLAEAKSWLEKGKYDFSSQREVVEISADGDELQAVFNLPSTHCMRPLTISGSGTDAIYRMLRGES
jgi:hypothetical protein